MRRNSPGRTLLLAVVAFISLATLLGATYLIEPWESCLGLTSRLYFQAYRGTFAVFSELDDDSGRVPRPYVPAAVSPTVESVGDWAVPGFRLQYGRYAAGQGNDWALAFSLWIPTSLAAIPVLVLLRKRTQPVSRPAPPLIPVTNG